MLDEKPIIEVNHLDKYYGKFQALKDINLREGMFSVNLASFYIANLTYKNSGTGESLSNTDSVEIKYVNLFEETKEIRIQDNFALIRPGKFDYPIGNIRNTGVYDQIEFNLGVPSPAKNAVPASLPVGHPLYIQEPILQNSPIDGYISCQVSIKKDTFVQTPPDTFNLYNTELLNFNLNQAINAENGQDQSVVLRLNYLNLFEGIEFALDDDKVILQKMTSNLTKLLEIED